MKKSRKPQRIVLWRPGKVLRWRLALVDLAKVVVLVVSLIEFCSTRSVSANKWFLFASVLPWCLQVALFVFHP